MKKIVFAIITIILSFACTSELKEAVEGSKGSSKDDQMTYCGQPKPNKTPRIFAPEFISKKNRNEFGICFSKNGKELFFGIDKNGKAETHYSKWVDGVWSKPEAILIDDVFSFNDPMLSPDENRLYFISDKSLDNSKNKKDYDIWYIEKNDTDWSEPINAGTNINTSSNEYFISLTSENKMYFSSNKEATENNNNNFDIYSSTSSNNKFNTAVKLGANINTNRYEADVFIAPDESYIIFCARRSDGFGRGDLYISFKDEKGNWSPSKNMGETINSKNHELCPFVSNDGKYFFYTSDQDIYWVSMESIWDMKK